jgi:hypothetical protein
LKKCSITTYKFDADGDPDPAYRTRPAHKGEIESVSLLLLACVADSHHLDADLDPACHFDADLDTDPAVDPDPVLAFI